MTDLKNNEKFSKLLISEIVIPASHHSGLTSIVYDDQLIEVLASRLGFENLLGLYT